MLAGKHLADPLGPRSCDRPDLGLELVEGHIRHFSLVDPDLEMEMSRLICLEAEVEVHRFSVEAIEEEFLETFW